jgi:two-component system OmpR family sensor kinase
VRIWVEDQGPGIPLDERDRVWEPYVRLSRGIEAASGGSGIGLSVVRELVTLHGGTAWIESAGAQGGARVMIELPTRTMAAESPTPQAVRETDRAPAVSEH